MSCPASSSSHPPQSQTTIPNNRPNRIKYRTTEDTFATSYFGDSIYATKQPSSLRIFFQNIKGMSHSKTIEDYKYLATSLEEIHVDISGLAETNTAWQHPFLCNTFSTAFRRYSAGNTAKISFASPSSAIDPMPTTETFQAGGSLTTATGPWATTIFGTDIHNNTGLGRWSGFHVRGKHNKSLSVITGYQTCSGSRITSPLGSTFHRESEFFRDSEPPNLSNPRTRFLIDISALINDLKNQGHAIILMLDANSVLAQESAFSATITQLQLHDLHKTDPAPSTYIGSPTRRIDYIFGCTRVLSSLVQAGSLLSYLNGPQSDHRGLFVDIHAHLLLHHHAQDNSIQPPRLRQLKTGNPELVATYIASMSAYYHDHNMVRRIEDLYANHSKLSDDNASHSGGLGQRSRSRNAVLRKEMWHTITTKPLVTGASKCRHSL